MGLPFCVCGIRKNVSRVLELSRERERERLGIALGPV